MTDTQPPAQPYPPQGYYQGPPPKKKHTLRNVLLVIVLLFVLCVGGCIALIGGAVDSADKAIKKEQANDKPTVVTMGKAFEHDGYKVDAGWSLAAEFGSPTIKGLHITNTQKSDSGGSGRTALLTFRFYKGTENLAEIECDGKELQQGEASTMDCFSSDKMPKGYDTIKVADMF